MMGWMLASSHCIGCRMIFSYNPNRVPSILVNGEREPVCRSCVEAANPERIKKGLEPFTIRADAYEPEECA